jgi:hypothetical protein
MDQLRPKLSAGIFGRNVIKYKRIFMDNITVKGTYDYL